MKQTTYDLIKNVLSTDDTITPDDSRDILRQLQEAKTVPKPCPGTIKQAAEILGEHPVTIRRYAKCGLITPIRITSRKVRYDLNEVKELANTGAHNA
jgi:hypothetical protein